MKKLLLIPLLLLSLTFAAFASKSTYWILNYRVFGSISRTLTFYDYGSCNQAAQDLSNQPNVRITLWCLQQND